MTGIAWYRRDEYVLLRALASDTDSMALTYLLRLAFRLDRREGFGYQADWSAA
jgi:hypothetical protein